MVSISFERNKRPVQYHYDKEDLQLTKIFSKKLKAELNDLLKCVILFGSAVRGDNTKESDIDVMLILNDLTVVLSEEVITSLRVIIENVASVTGRIHPSINNSLIASKISS